MKKITVAGNDFKALVSGVTKFPGLGMFGGSDLVSLQASEGILTASSFGVVLAIGKKKCEGNLALVAIDERVIQNFAGVVADSAVVSIWCAGKELYLKSGRNEVSAALIDGTVPKGPELPKSKLKLTAQAADAIRYLADIAYNDVTRPELCCVMLSKSGMASALDQKTVAELHTGLSPDGRIPLPLHIAKAVQAGNLLYVDSTVTVLRASGIEYSMPSLVAATKNYPFGTLKTLRGQAGHIIATVKGSRLSGAIEDCTRCLGQLARTEAVADIQLSSGVLKLAGTNGGARFETTVKLDSLLEDAGFTTTVTSLERVRPFIDGEVRIAKGEHGDLYLHTDAGWSMFPSEMKTEGKKK